MKRKTRLIVRVAAIFAVVSVFVLLFLYKTPKEDGPYTCFLNEKRSVALNIEDGVAYLVGGGDSSAVKINRSFTNTYKLSNGNYMYWNGTNFGAGKTRKEAQEAPFVCKTPTQMDYLWLISGAN